MEIYSVVFPYCLTTTIILSSRLLSAIVITEKVGDKYNVYAATGFDRDTKQSYTWEEVTKGAVRFFLVDNINRNSNNTTTPDIPSTISSQDTISRTNPNDQDNMKSLELKIGDTIVYVSWLDNSSVNALKELAKKMV